MAKEDQPRVKGKYYKKKLKAKEVLRLYQEENERDFQGVILRGQSFKRQDLSGADFSEADISSTNFSNARLLEAKFSQAKVGLQKRWIVILLLCASFMTIVSGFFPGFVGVTAIYLFSEDSKINAIHATTTILAVSVLILIFFYIIYRKGLVGGISSFGSALTGSIILMMSGVIAFGLILELKLLLITPSDRSSILEILFICVALIFTASILTVMIIIFISIAGIYTVLFSSIIAVVYMVAGSITSSLLAAFSLILNIMFVVLVNLHSQIQITEGVMLVVPVPITIVVSGLIVFPLVLLPTHISWQAVRGDDKNAWLNSFAVAVAAVRGSNFRCADLTDANFRGVMFRSTDFRRARLARVDWYRAKMLNRARTGDSYLKDSQMRQYITGHGTNNIFDNKNLQGINLQGVNLINASFINTDLSEADLSGTTLTGACIQDWNINSETKLHNVACDYIFLKKDNQERRPSNPNKTFAPGDFANLVQKSLSTVDLIFSDGIDWQSFLKSFERLQIEDGNGELIIQAIERKTNGAFVVRVEVPPDIDKAKIEKSFWEKYNPILEAKDREIKLLSQQTDFYSQQVDVIRTENTRLIGIVETMAEKEGSKYDLRGAKFAGGFAAEGGTQLGGTFNDYSIVIEGNIDDIERLIGSLRENIQHFPDEQREDAEMELEDLEEEVRNPKKRNLKRFKKIIKGLLAAGGTASVVASGAVDFSENINKFTDNVTELGEQLEVSVDYIRDKLED